MSDRQGDRDLTGFRGPSYGGPARPQKPGNAHAGAKRRVVVPFEDNRFLSRLLGEHDAHLALIEDRLGIAAQAHGNVVTLTGAAPDCEVARAVLEQAARGCPVHKTLHSAVAMPVRFEWT